MSLNCRITAGVDVTCEALRRVSGVAKKAWVFNLADFRTPIDQDANGYVSNFDLDTYDSAYPFESKKFSHQGQSDLVVAESGSVSYTHTVTLRLFNDSPTEDTALEDLAVAEVVVVLRTNNDEFLIYGAANGLSATADTQGTGRNLGEDTTSTVTLTGSEIGRPLRLLRGGSVALTLQYLEALEV